MTFEEVVAEWLRLKGHPEVDSVTKVDAHGSDWAGDTEGGFYERFEVTVWWTRTDGTQTFSDASGEEMQSLWMHVVGAWGEDARP